MRFNILLFLALLALPVSAASNDNVSKPVAHVIHFELRESLPGMPRAPKQTSPHPEDTSPSACQCVYGPPGSGVRVCGCYCDAGTACVPGDNSCQECSIYHHPY
jgi:hypothetical protein